MPTKSTTWVNVHCKELIHIWAIVFEQLSYLALTSIIYSYVLSDYFLFPLSFSFRQNCLHIINSSIRLGIDCLLCISPPVNSIFITTNVMDFISTSEESWMHFDSFFLLFFRRYISKQSKILLSSIIWNINIIKQRTKRIRWVDVILLFLLSLIFIYPLLLLLLLFFFLFYLFFCLKMYFWSIFNYNILISFKELIHIQYLRKCNFVTDFLSLEGRIIQSEPIEL